MAAVEPWKKKVEIFKSRFVARDDVFYSKRQDLVKNADGTFKDVSRPIIICGNYGNQDLCQIAQRRGGCFGCDNKLNKPLTDEVIYQHISGQQDVIPALVTKDGIRYGAVDFDRGTVFEDAKAVRDLSVALGVPCYISRSSMKGYHVYWFFKEFVKIELFTSYIRYIFEELGFYQRQLVASEHPIPEVFPKQGYVEGKIGNGIKVPMIEPKMREGKNCWVDDDAEPLPFDKQWEYLEKTVLIPVANFEAILVEKGVEILVAPASKDRQAAKGKKVGDKGTELKRVPHGNFWSVVEGCPAMKEYWGKDQNGKFTWNKTHHDGNLQPYAAYHQSIMVGLATVNGIEEIRKRFPDEDTAKQITYAENNGYSPMTCKTMQEKGVCLVGKHPRCGDHCLKKLPPVVYENGIRTPNPDGVPEAQWPDPSPIRFATDRNLSADDIVERLGAIFTALKEASKKDGDKSQVAFAYDDPQERIHSLIAQAVLMGEDAESKVESALSANRWMSKKELQPILKKIKKEKGDKKAEKIRKTHKTFMLNGDEFIMKDDGYHRMFRNAKGEPQPERLTNFHIIIHEEIVTIRADDKVDLGDDTKATDRDYKGTIHCDGQTYPLEAKFNEWATADGFFKNIAQQGGSSLHYERKNYDYIRNCIYRFSKDHIVHRKSIRQIGHHKLKGRGVYLMPGVLVDKESIRPNDEFVIPQFSDEVSADLDFALISQEEFKDLSRHIIDDFFQCNNAMLTMTTFAHAMCAVLIPAVKEAVGFKKAPVLWLAGSQTGGKTFVAQVAQNFYGDFETIQSSSGTAKSRLGNGYNFRHAWMLVDDYKKHLNDPFGKDFPGLVQAAYDRTGRSALQRNGEARAKVDKIRGMLCITGEDILESEASAVARTVMIDVPLSKNREAGKKVASRYREYNGFTPYVVKYVLGMDEEEVEKLWTEYFNGFYDPVKEAYTDADRTCENLAFVMLAFRVALETMVAEGAIDAVERERLCRVQLENLCLIRTSMLEMIKATMGGKVFVDTLKEMLQNSNKCYIQKWPGYGPGFEAPSNSIPIGFYRESTPDIIYLYPSTAHGQICETARKGNTHVQTKTHVARQLYDLGMMVKDRVSRKENRYSIQMRGPDKSSVWVWPLYATSLGLESQVKTSVETVASKRDLDDPLPLSVVSGNKES